jgi:hypothetical protein
VKRLFDDARIRYDAFSSGCQLFLFSRMYGRDRRSDHVLLQQIERCSEITRSFIRNATALLSTTRSSTAIADHPRSFPRPAAVTTLALSQIWLPYDGHRGSYGCPDPTPFSTLSRRSRRMIQKFQSPSLGAAQHGSVERRVSYTICFDL